MSDSWKSPGAILGIAGAVLTAVGLFIGYVQYERKQALDEKKHQLEESDRAEQKRKDEKAAAAELEKLESIRKKKILEIDTELGKIDKQIQKCKSELDKIIATVDEINRTEPRTAAVRNEFKKWKQIRTDKYNEISSLEEKKAELTKEKEFL